MSKLHPIAKKHKYKSNEDFYKDFPDKESYLKKFPDGGNLPIQTTDPNKVRAYNDSLAIYNYTSKMDSMIANDMIKGVLPIDKAEIYKQQIIDNAPRIDSLVNDLRGMGINYKVKGSNKIPIGDINGEYSGFDAKLQKAAPKPKQPYFFVDGGNMPKFSAGGSAITGALAGAGTGATIGSILPGYGTLIGAGVGALAGGIAGFIGGKDEEKLQEEMKKDNQLAPILPITNPNPTGNEFKMGGDLTKYSGPSHEKGGIKINKLGVPVNNPNDAIAEVEGGESFRNNYVYSDTLGIDKLGNPTSNSKKVHKTFADISKTIDKKYSGKIDEIAKMTKEFEYKNLKDMNESVLQAKALKASQRFQKKYGGILKYPYGGGLVGQGLKDYLIQNPMLNTNLSPGQEVYTTPEMDAIQLESQGLPIDPNTPFGNTQTKQSSSGPKIFNPEVSTDPSQMVDFESFQNKAIGRNPTPTTPAPASPDWSRYIGLATNAIGMADSLLSKSHNYRVKASNDGLRELQNLPTEPDYSQAYNRNTNSLRAANKNAGLTAPASSQALKANNLGIKLNADNEIAFQSNREKLGLVSNKINAISQERNRINSINEQGKYQYNLENIQDKARRTDSFMTYLNAAGENVQQSRNDDYYMKTINDVLKNYKIDPKNPFAGDQIFQYTGGSVPYFAIQSYLNGNNVKPGK